MLTATTITDEQIEPFTSDADLVVAATAHYALGEVPPQRLLRRLTTAQLIGINGTRASRARLAEILNARAKEAK